MIDTDQLAHPNSLLFNAFPGFWPFKAYWFFRKVSFTQMHGLVNSQYAKLPRIHL